MFTVHFGLRGGKEQRDLKWGDVELNTNSNDKEYLEYSTERQRLDSVIIHQTESVHTTDVRK